MRLNIAPSNSRDPKGGETWRMNHFFFEDKTCDKLFIMDGINGLSFIRDETLSRDEMVERLNRKGYAAVTPRKEEGLENNEIYPLKEIQSKYGVLYFKSTVAYMLGYAALKEYDEIHLYGARALGVIEYLNERPSVEYWLGVLRGQGASITFRDLDTRLLGGRPSFGGSVLYGYEVEPEEALQNITNS